MVAYPLAPVGDSAVGGAEQVVFQLDRALVAAGHRSIVVACAGSRIAGELVEVPRTCGPFLDDTVERVHRVHAAAIQATLAHRHVDVIHMHGHDFASYLPPPGVPVLATLHLPIQCYAPSALAPGRPGTYLQCVSRSQQAKASDLPLLSPIENGVPEELFAAEKRQGSFALMLSRICPEKGVHIAMDAAKRADVPLVIAGEVFPYPDHQRYFEREVRPRLDRHRRFIGAVNMHRKLRLLAAARCVLVPSLIDETCSLVAREALAAGTAVVAFARGALAESVEHGRTGFLVNNELEMAQAIAASPSISPAACRNVARRRFSTRRMAGQYMVRYGELVRRSRRLGEVG
jgi:glycosyltransferase involved in cell wall biosynthesis